MRSFMSSRIIQALAPRARTARVFVAIAVAGLSAAACDVHGISEPGSLSAIVVSPNPATIAVNGTQQFSAVGKDYSGGNVTISPSWSVVAGGGTISASGLFTAGPTPGTYASTVKATSGSISGTATVIVTTGPLASITVTPNPDTLAINGTQLFTAVGRDVAGNVVVITPTWSVVASGGTITTAGSFTAGTVPGTFLNTVKATSGTLSGTADVVVTPGPLASITVTPTPVTLAINGTQQFTAVGKDSSGNVVAITPVWSAVSGGTIITGTGLFTAGTVPATFNNTVKAAVGTVNGTATVVVTVGTLASVTVTPDPATVAINGIQQFIATGLDIAGNPVVITPTWSVVASGGTINATGSFTAGTVPGTFIESVKATSGAFSGTATVVVTAGTLATITVTPSPATTAINGMQQFTAVGKDSSGNVVGITPTWSVVASGGTIDATTGLFTAGLTTGTFTNTVNAAVGTVNGTATVIVTPGQLDRIIVTPNPDSVSINGQTQFIATGRDITGNPVAITPTWAVVASGGTIDATTGLFTAGPVLGTFIKTVTATSGTHTGTATVVVTAGALASIKVTPNPDTVAIYGIQQFIATGRDASGNLVALTSAPTWSVDSGGGTINSTTGLFTAGLTTGTFPNTVKATVGTVNGTATVVVIVAQPFLDLGRAAPNGIMAGTTVTCTTGGAIYADVSVSPGATLTLGTPPCVITGNIHLGDTVAANAQLDLTTAYNTLFGLPCPAANLIGTTDIGGNTLPAGVYCSGTSIGVTGNLTLDGGGNPNAVFVFQAGTSLITAGNVVLINGAQAKNVYWVVGSSATLGTGSQWKGNILALTSITLDPYANLIGRALARNGAVTLGTSNVIALP